MTMTAAIAGFCRACGDDHPGGTVTCPRCGWTTVDLPPRVRGPVGDVHLIRRKVRRRWAVRLGDDGAHAHLLLESGEELSVPVTDLPVPSASPVPWESVVRSAPGRLLELASAIVRDPNVAKWDPDALRAAAVAAASDQVAVRLLALDALALGMEDLLPQLALTPSERVWLVAVRCAQLGDAARLVHHVAALPPEGYAGKVGLLVDLAAAIHQQDLDVSVLDPQLRPFLDRDPAARALHRAFELSGSDPAASVADARWLAGRLDGTHPARREIEWGAAQVLDDAELEAATGQVDGALVGPHVRALAAVRHPGSTYLGAGDVRFVADSVVDDLIDAGSLDAPTALAEPRDEAARTYLTGRLVPDRLTDGELVGLGHDDEQARRTFPLADPTELERLADSPWMRHFRSLALVRLHRGAEVDLGDVRPEDRANVEALLAAVTAAADGEPVVDRLTGTLLRDPTVWPVLAALVGPVALRPSADLAVQFPEFCEWLALHHAREYLFRGDWSAAVAATDRCLALAKGERVQDEALNLKACGLYYLGDSTAAVAALEEAIEGAYSEALLANVGIVAALLKPEVAARHLGKLMVEAPNVAMRVTAGRRVVHIWLSSDTDSWHSSGGSDLPDAVRGPLRSLVADDIGIEDFRGLAKLLAQHDGAWFADPSRLAGSPHRRSLDARIYQAQARSLQDLVDAIAAARKAGDLPDWLEGELRDLREGTVKFVLDNIDDSSLSVGTLPIAMFEKGVLETAYEKVLFPAMGLASLAHHMTEAQEAELADRFVMMTWAMRDRWKALPTEERERVAPIVTLATTRLAINRGIGREKALDAAIDAYNAAVGILERGGNVYVAAPRIRAAREVAIAVAEELQGWLGVVEPPDLRDAIRNTLSSAHELDARCTRFL